jgi:hypothetical protein
MHCCRSMLAITNTLLGCEEVANSPWHPISFHPVIDITHLAHHKRCHITADLICLTLTLTLTLTTTCVLASADPAAWSNHELLLITLIMSHKY